jgi:DNA-binding beta-propeller fold protein YncE
MRAPSMKSTLALLLTLSAAHAGGIYWTNRGAGLLERSLYDGTGRTTIRSGAGANLRGLWLDLPNNRIYYCDNGADNIHRVNFDNTGFATLLPTGPSSFPADIEIDPAAGHLYYCDRDKFHIRRTNLDGLNPVTLVTDSTFQPYYLDLDFVNGKIYWGDFDGVSTNTGNVFRMNLDGTGRETVVTGNLETRGVCVDTEGGMLYWVNRNFAGIMRCKLSDLPVSATDSSKAKMLYSGLDTPHGMALDVPAGKVYWVDTGTNPGTGLGSEAISRGDMDGSGPHEVLVNLGNEPWDIEVDPRVASYAEWTARFFVRNPGAIAAANADPDNDGIINVMECALGLRPRLPDVSGLPVVVTLSDAGEYYPAIRFTRRTGVAGLLVLPQQSFDMEYWWDETSPTAEIPHLTQVSTTPLPENMELVTFRSIYSLRQNPRQYLRVRAQLAP